MRTEKPLWSRARARFALAAALGAAMLPGLDGVRAQSSKSHAPVRLVHVLKTRGAGIPRPTSLAHVPSGAFVMVVNRGAAFTDLVLVSHGLSVVGRVRIDAAFGSSNMAFDAKSRRLLALETREDRLWMIPIDAAGRPDASLLAAADVRHFGVQDAQGMAVDPRSGHLFILDAAGPRLVRVEPDADGRFEAARVAEVALPVLGAAALRGLALHPTTGHLHLLSPKDGLLYEVRQTGALVATRDVSKVGLRSPQAMAFAPSGDSTDATGEQNLFIADAGHVAAGEMASAAARTSPAAGAGLVELSFAVPPSVEPTESLLSSVLLVDTTATSEFNPPSPDPSGIEYVADLGQGGHLWISDGEVEETALWTGKNVFETTLGGTLVASYGTEFGGTPFSEEPVGVGVAPNRHLFYSDDDQRRVFEIDPGPDQAYHTSDDSLTSFKTTDFAGNDPEGVAYDPTTGTLLLAGGEDSEVWRVDPGPDGLFNGVTPAGDDTVTHFDTFGLGIVDPEGIAVNPDTGNIYISGEPVTLVAELNPAGTMVVNLIDISAANPVRPAGVAYGPTSTDPTARSLYIVDRVVDNNHNPNENDGRMYELTISYAAPPNTAPTVSAGSDQTITFPAAAALDGDVADDGLPMPPATTVTWSKRSGPGNVTFALPNAVDTTASFSVAGTYVLRLTASDGVLSTSDDLTVAVLAPNELRVAFGADDAEERVNGTVALGNIDLELVNNTEGGVTGDQTVGLRFRAVPVVQGATITNAYIQFQADESHSGVTDLVIEGQDADNAAVFTNQAGNISSRPRTSAFATWSPAAWTTGDAGPAQRTDNIAPVIQEIVSRPGWASGNSLVLIITGTGKRVAETFEGLPTGAALLHIESNSPPPTNQPPSVNAGPDLAVTFPDLVTLDGFATDDGLPHPPGLVTTTWSKFSGPGSVTFGNPNSLETFAIFSEPGTYVLRLTANDSVLGASDDVIVTVNEEGQSTLAVVKKGGIHTATDAGSYSFPSFAAQDDHLYVVFLNTAIGSGAAPAATSVAGAGLTFTEIGAAGGLPYSAGSGVRRMQAWRALSSSGAATGQIAITLNGTSIGMDAVVLEFSGMDTSGTNGEGAIAQSATNKVTGNTALTVTLAPFANPSNRPVAFFSHRVNEPTTEESGYTELDDAGHSAPATSSSCEWNAITTDTTPSVTWLTSQDGGGFAIEVRIADSAPPPNQPPSVDAGPNDSVTLPASANLNGTVSDDGLPNPPGVLTTTWSKFSGPGNVTFGNANAVDTTATFSLPGTYVLRLTASDSDLTVSDDVTITVGGQAPVSVFSKAAIHAATDASSYSFGSVAASNNLLYVVFLNTAIGSGTAPAVTSISGAGLTFTEIGTPGGLLYSASASVRRIQAFHALSSAGAGTGTIAINLNGTSIGMDAVLLEISGMDASGTNGSGAIAQSATNNVMSGTALTVSLAAFGNPSNRPVAFFSHRTAEATTEEPGYMQLDDGSHTGPTTGTSCEWNATTADTTPSASWATASDAGGFAIEVKAAP